MRLNTGSLVESQLEVLAKVPFDWGKPAHVARLHCVEALQGEADQLNA
jgi:hypothetical protein